MSMKGKIFLLAGVLAVFVAAAVLVSSRSRLAPIRSHPMDTVPNADVSRIFIQEPSMQVDLQQKEGMWRVVAPLDDWAEPSTIDSLISTLNGVTIGSVISENKERFPTFQLGEGQATHLQVYGKDTKTPILDLFIGKQAISYGTCYVRVAGQNKVCVAENLPDWILMRPVDDFRKRGLFPSPASQLDKISVKADNLSLDLSRSSQTWTVAGSTGPLDVPTTNVVLTKFENLRVAEFVDKIDPAVKTGLDRPFLTITGVSPNGSTKVDIGAKKPVKKGEMVDERYMKISNRTPVFLVTSAAVDELLKQLKSLKQ